VVGDRQCARGKCVEQATGLVARDLEQARFLQATVDVDRRP
jgi:hypothetical protein